MKTVFRILVLLAAATVVDGAVKLSDMDKVVDRCRYDELRKREQQEQKELDERAMQLGLVRGDD